MCPLAVCNVLRNSRPSRCPALGFCTACPVLPEAILFLLHLWPLGHTQWALRLTPGSAFRESYSVSANLQELSPLSHCSSPDWPLPSSEDASMAKRPWLSFQCSMRPAEGEASWHSDQGISPHHPTLHSQGFHFTSLGGPHPLMLGITPGSARGTTGNAKN